MFYLLTRYDGTFPHYTKLEYNKSSPPQGWNEGARRCMECKRDWPNLPEFSPSPCCNMQAGVVSDASTEMTWADAYGALMLFRFERIYEKWNDGMTDVELIWTSNESYNEDLINEGLEEINSLILSVEHNDTKT